MKVLVVGNYLADGQWSMIGFAKRLAAGLERAGVEVVETGPEVKFGGSLDSAKGKWLGYVDKYLLYPPKLKKLAKSCDAVIVCDQANAVYAPALKPTPSLLCGHDFLAVRASLGEIPYWPMSATGRRLQTWISRSAPNFDAFTAVSGKTKSDMQRLFGLPADRIEVVNNAFFTDYRAGSGLAAEGDFLLHVGGNQPYKNRPGVVRLASRWMQRPEMAKTKLILMGAEPDDALREEIEKSDVKDRIEVEVKGSNERLESLYRGARALLFLSHDEGFGLPILEAMSAGCPVITGKSAPMTEVGGQAALYVDSETFSGEEAAYQALVQDRPALIETGFENLDRFAEEKMIQDYVRILENMTR